MISHGKLLETRTCLLKLKREAKNTTIRETPDDAH